LNTWKTSWGGALHSPRSQRIKGEQSELERGRSEGYDTTRDCLKGEKNTQGKGVVLEQGHRGSDSTQGKGLAEGAEGFLNKEEKPEDLHEEKETLSLKRWRSTGEIDQR